MNEIRTFGGRYLNGVPVHQDNGCLVDAVTVEKGAVC